MDISIKIKNNWSYYTIINKELYYNILNLMLKVTSHSFITFSGKTKKSAHENELKLIDLAEKRFPTGLLWLIVKTLEDQSIDVEIIDQREVIEDFPIPCNFQHILDENQLKALEIGKLKCRGYFKFPTGAGKTSIIASLIGIHGGNSLVIVPSIDLVSQLQKDLSKILNKSVSIIIGHKSLEENISDIIVASIDTLVSNYQEITSSGWLDQFTAIYGDEIHHASFTKGNYKKRIQPGFTGYYQLFMASTAYFRYGFSASDGESSLFIRAILGEKLLEVTEDSLIESGRLSKPIFLIYKHSVEYYSSDTEAYIKGIYENETRNKVLISLMNKVKELNGTVLFMFDSIKYQLNQIRNWVDFPIVTGETKLEERNKLYEKIKNKEISGLILSVGKEGLNLPSVDVIIRASAKKSEKLIIQEKGRGSRISKDKNRYFIIDTFDDDGVKKIFDPVSHHWRSKVGFLRKHSLVRLSIYKSIKKSEIHISDSVEELSSILESLF